jgi:hypothetical protein
MAREPHVVRCRIARQHDRGSATPLLVALVALTSLATLAVSRLAESAIEASRAATAAEALALAAIADADLDRIARYHQVDEFDIEYADETVVASVVRRGVEARATAIDHRRTLDVGE